ncbi:glutelin [Microvirga brassicacearum]|uniref:Glutelin n=1 Tax=Microvirga brassicacearum TaxID=2580413 RepID=A0A5N3P723_9HYPH|nr:glutelin [Microvirga brassicacearum]KAB0265530.1 glutelin [Microvirga brassicacearum]
MTDLRKSGMKPALIVDHLIGVYCPLVAADAILSDKQNADRVRRFARLVTDLAYVPSDPDEVDVLVQTALPPDLLSQVDQSAGRAGLSRDEWIERSIKRQLSVP